MLVGTEFVIDATGCSPDALRDAGRLRSLCDRVLRELELVCLAPALWHQFPPPGGLTGLYLLTESHLACHTFPEHGVATFNLHCCRARPRWAWEAALREILDADHVHVRELPRGGGP